MSQYGWTLWASIQDGDERHRFRLLELGAGEVRAGRGDLPRARPRAPPGRRDAGRLSRPRPAERGDRCRGDTTDGPHAGTRAARPGPGGGHRRRRRSGPRTAYHLARLGWTDVVLLEQGQLSSRHDVARGRPARPAAGDRGRDPPGAVLGAPLRRARGGDRPGHRPQALRRRHGGPHARPDGPAPADGGHGRGRTTSSASCSPRPRPWSATRCWRPRTCSAPSGCPATARSTRST